jgi:hypothetical protein
MIVGLVANTLYTAANLHLHDRKRRKLERKSEREGRGNDEPDALAQIELRYVFVKT